MKEIQLRDAKATLSAVVDEAMRGKPAVITRHGKRQAVVVSYKEWERLSHVPDFRPVADGSTVGGRRSAKPQQFWSSAL